MPLEPRGYIPDLRFRIIDHNDDSGQPLLRRRPRRRPGVGRTAPGYRGRAYMALETRLGDMPHSEALRTAELLSTEVIPHFT